MPSGKRKKARADKVGGAEEDARREVRVREAIEKLEKLEGAQAARKASENNRRKRKSSNIKQSTQRADNGIDNTSTSVDGIWCLACDSQAAKSSSKKSERCDGAWICAEDCTGRNSPFCVCSYKKSNQSKRKGLWKKDTDLLVEIGDDPATYERRVRHKDGGEAPSVNPAGLRNLGATCYANSVLQCLFHILELRRNLLTISLEGARAPARNGAIPDELLIVDGIHKLFAELQLSPIAVVNPEHFLTQVLQLNKDVQQDCQEFWTLLHCSLDAALQKLEDKTYHNLMKSNFVGQTSHKTVCKKCKQPSKSSKNLHDFQVLELEVKDTSTGTGKRSAVASLETSFETYLTEEMLEGDNKYFCEYCNSRQNAARRTEINNLPNHLILQLKRFRFDMKTFERKKIKANYSFPLSVDMAPFLAKEKSDKGRKSSGSKRDESIYDVEAIILHKGKSAAQGHYISLVKREEDQQWWQFDDQTVTCVGPDLSVLSNFVKDKEKDGSLMSTQVYVIVYRNRKSWQKQAAAAGTEITVDILPPTSKQQLSGLLTTFRDSKESYQGKRNLFLKQLAHKRETVESFFDLAGEKGSGAGQSYCLGTQDLATWATTMKGCEGIDMRAFRCAHNMVDPRRIEEVKVVSSSSFELLKASVPVTPVLSSDMLCVACLKDIYQKELTELEMEKRNRELLAIYGNETFPEMLSDKALQVNGSSNQNFYVSKRWYQRWLRGSIIRDTMQSSPTDNIICQHGNILPDPRIQRDLEEIPGHLWDYFAQTCAYFGTPAPEVRTTTEVCQSCAAALAPLRHLSSSRSIAKAEKKVVEAIREITAKSPLILKAKDVYRIVPIKWYYEWKKLLCEKATAQALIQSILNCMEEVKGLINKHGDLLCVYPFVSFTKAQMRRNAWHQSLHESNVLILKAQSWKMLRNIAGVRESVEIELQMVFKKDLPPQVAIQPSSGTARASDSGSSAGDLPLSSLWVFGNFESEGRKAIQVEVGGSSAVSELMGIIEAGDPKPKGTITGLFHCQRPLQDRPGVSLSSLGLTQGDVVYFETTRDGEESSEDGGEEKNFEGTRLMS